jgi:hypothetical protein
MSCGYRNSTNIREDRVWRRRNPDPIASRFELTIRVNCAEFIAVATIRGPGGTPAARIRRPG